MTDYTSTGRPQFMRTVTSDATVLGDTVVIDLSTDRDFGALTHCFLGVRMFDGTDPETDTQIDDSAGTFTVTIETINTTRPESPTVSVINATAPVTISWNANTHKITVVPALLSDTVVYQVVATANRN